MGEMVYNLTCLTCIKFYVIYFHVREKLVELNMVNFDFVNFIFCGLFNKFVYIQNSKRKRHPNRIISAHFFLVGG